ncbi:cytochrome c-type biogenesis protein [Propylenella binzhouense]|uniref:Cytochrome c-type biogenesis protein n=1 Tax=Propylenella binzhouense TaxID=2555902 RepID=A0A964T5P5_9HYPH|nr:cytochrome c-type biogenesis protein [Propylenella binzhouense]MYZ48879.1 cytochrome c-type biogenesis protein CcmH [Propylenella binzhouense]
MRLAGLALTALLVAGPALAVTPEERLADPALEARARAISEELRCLVCQNQSIDDSEAPLAHDLRVLVRERLEAGDSDAAVKQFLVDRYGEFVLLRPTFSESNLLLWAAPFLVLLAGIALAFLFYRRRRAAAGTERLSAEEEEALARVLGRPEQG